METVDTPISRIVSSLFEKSTFTVPHLEVAISIIVNVVSGIEVVFAVDTISVPTTEPSPPEPRT